MTPELQKYYEARMEMTSSQGWKDLMEDVEMMKKATDSLSGVDTVEKLHFRKGELSLMDWILSIAKVSEDAYQHLKEEQSAEDVA